MSTHTWAVELQHGERQAVCRDADGAEVSRWVRGRNGNYYISSTRRGGPPWLTPPYGVPAIVMDLLCPVTV